jgi:hypothetical protein
MAVLSVDLAFRSWSDLGLAVLDCEAAPGAADGRARSPIHYELLEPALLTTWTGAPALREKVDPLDLANRLHALCLRRDIRMILLDGPQAWKSKLNGLEYSRVCERALNTSAKTGLPGVVLPGTWTHFVESSIAVFNALTLLGWNRFNTRTQPGAEPERTLVEIYPFAAWKELGLKPLPCKRRARISDRIAGLSALQSLLPLAEGPLPSHDQLQALVGGLAGLALSESDPSGFRILGHPPRREEGHWREGYIILPLPPHRTPAMRWLE